MYVCGPTVYDEPHLGHGRFALVWDVLRRYLEWSGLTVRFVSNVTDIDDKIIERAEREGRTAADVAHQYEKAWYEALDALAVRRPDDDPHATAYVTQMVDLVGQLVAKGAAYETSDGVYFSVSAVDDYGLRAQQARDRGRARTRVDVNPSGLHRGGLGARAGTPSAWSWRSTSWARTSTCTAPASTWPSPITRTNGPRPWPWVGPLPGGGPTVASSSVLAG